MRSTIRISGPLAGHVPELGSYLLRQGYTILSCRNLLRLASHLSRWLEQQGLGLRDLFDEQVDSFVRARRAEGYTHFLSPRSLVAIRRYLAEARLTPETAGAAPPRTPLEQLLSDYEGSLLHDRGLTPVWLRSTAA